MEKRETEAGDCDRQIGKARGLEDIKRNQEEAAQGSPERGEAPVCPLHFNFVKQRR